MKIQPKLPDFIRIRIERGFSQRKLAQAAGLSSAFISQLENQKRNLGPEAAQLICQALGVDFDKIFELL